MFFVFKQKTAYEMRMSDWSSDVCSSDLDVGLLPIVPADAVVVCNGELDRIDAREIGGVERMLAPRARLRLLPEHPRQRIGDRIERRDGGQVQGARAPFETDAQIAADEGEEDHADRKSVV